MNQLRAYRLSASPIADDVERAAALFVPGDGVAAKVLVQWTYPRRRRVAHLETLREAESVESIFF